MFYSRAILELQGSEGLHDLGSIKWDMALCLFAVYIICYFSLWKGISTSGKVIKAKLSSLNPLEIKVSYRYMYYLYCLSGRLVHCFVPLRRVAHIASPGHHPTGLCYGNPILSQSQLRSYYSATGNVLHSKYGHESWPTSCHIADKTVVSTSRTVTKLENKS